MNKDLAHAKTIREHISTIRNQLSPRIADDLLELLKKSEAVAQATHYDELEEAQSKMEEFLL